MLLKSVFIGFLSFSILYAETLKECKNETDKISGCVEKGYYGDGWIETPFKNGKVDGIVKEYFENGKLEREAPYKNGKIEGMEKWYHYENGKLRAEIPYFNNLFHGDMRFYTEDGKLLALVKAENGRITSGKCFNGKALTDKELKEIYIDDIQKGINYLQKICLKSDSK